MIDGASVITIFLLAIACPFCGRDSAKIERTLVFWYVICEVDCNACGPSADTPEKAAELWNARKG